MSAALPRVKRFAWMLLLLAAGRLTAAEAVTFYPDWFTGPQFAGIYLAEDRGYFAAEGLVVTVVPFAFGRKHDPLLATNVGTALGCIEGYIFLQHQARGDPLVALAATLQESPAGYMSLAPVKIRTAADFAGKRVGVHRYGDVVYRWILAQAGVAESRATMSFVDDDVGRLMRGEIDVMQGYSTEEFLHLKALAGDRAQFISQRALGFDGYSEVIYTSREQQSAHGPTFDRFVAATRRGWTTAFAEPNAAVHALRKRMDGKFDEAFERSALLALQPLVCPSGQAPFAPMRPERWTALPSTP